MHTAMALLLGAVVYEGSPIAGPPTNVGTYLHSGSKIGFDWTLGDNSAQVQVSRDAGATVYDTLAPRTTKWNSALSQSGWDIAGYTFAVRHIDGIYTTAWVEYVGAE